MRSLTRDVFEGAVSGDSERGVLEMKEQVQEVLEKIRPALQADGGDVELVGVEDGVVTVKLVGACAGCPMSQMTLTNYVERLIKQEVPDVERVVPAA
jgi:Fe-S cluster biogenesis protein NfuA